jgi:hypothetical protein
VKLDCVGGRSLHARRPRIGRVDRALRPRFAVSPLCCDVEGERASVTSALSYTEPTAAQKARDARLETDDSTPEQASAERARGTSRVTGEARTFDGDVVTVFDGTVLLESTLAFKVDVGSGIDAAIPLSVVTPQFDLPKCGQVRLP